MSLFAILSPTAATIAFAAAIVNFTHFFQLNSYRAALQFKWMKSNPAKLFGCIFGIIAFFFPGSLIYILASAASVVLLFTKKAKKPLVYTMRVRRLLACTAALYIIPSVILYFVHGVYVQKFMAVMYTLSPLVVIAANIINKPMENAINRRYINDAKRLLESSGATVIGITGSYGKTSVKHYLATLLGAKYNVLMTPGSFNTPMGVVKTIRSSLSALHDIFICEMGAKRVGEIKEICDIVHPTHGVITAVGPQHLETFKSLDNIKKTKFELADSLPADGMLFLNGNDENINSYVGSRKNISYTLSGKGNYNAEILKLSENGTEFRVTAPGGEKCDFSTRLIGSHNVLNITGAIAVAHSLGISLNALKSQVRKLTCVKHRLELIKRGGDLLIDDAYNSNPSGTKAALETLSCFDGMKIIVTPGMVELGEKQNELNREFGKNIAGVCDYCILVGRRQTESIYAGLNDAGYDENKIYVASDINDAVSHAYALHSQNRKIILLENDLPDNYLN